MIRWVTHLTMPPIDPQKQQNHIAHLSNFTPTNRHKNVFL